MWSNQQESYRFKRTRLAVVAGIAWVLSPPVWAGELGPGESANVGAEDPVEEWFLEGGALLNVTPGGRTERINAYDGSVVNIQGGSVAATNQAGISLVNSTASIDDAQIVSTQSIGLSLSSIYFVSDDLSAARVSNSTIQGATSGVELEAAKLDLQASSVTGGNVGIHMADGELSVSKDSRITGDTGLEITAAQFYSPDIGNSVVIDASTVESRVNSTLLVRGDNDGTPTFADIHVRNGSTLLAGNGVILEVEEGATVEFTVDNSSLTGDVLAAPGSTTRVNLANGALLTGQLHNLETLSVSDRSTWRMVDSAQLNNLVMDRGTVELGGSNGDFRELTLGSLSGNGLFVLATDPVARAGDLLNVSGTASGQFDLKIQSTGHEPVTGDGLQQVVRTGGGDAQFSVLGGQVDVGAYAYELKQQGDDWYLAPKLDAKGKAFLTPSSQATLGLINATSTAWHGELAGLNSRLDELRAKGSSRGLWMRSYGSKYNVETSSGVSYQQRQNGFSLGADTLVTDELELGMLAGYSKSDLTLQGGNKAGGVDSYYLGIYGAWKAQDGYYVDAILKANRFHTESKVRMSDGELAAGHSTSIGLGASLEVGRSIALDHEWYLKPYGQLSALSVRGQNYTLDNGLQVRSDVANSVLGKVGSHLGYRFELSGGAAVQPYLKAALAHEFVDSAKVRINDKRLDSSLAGSRTEVGAGVAVHFSPALQLNVDLDYSNGKRIEQPLGASLGLRYGF